MNFHEKDYGRALIGKKEKMEQEEILSAGIDIGTSTTQLVFSRIVLQKTAEFGRIPMVTIISKEVIYRSNIYLTPLISAEIIDGDKVREIICKEYELAQINPKDVTTGAVIITGESSRKRNAAQVVEALSEIAGEFVVATAGPILESILAGKGAGASALSKENGKVVANMDIGGGTTNICYFKEGKVLDAGCVDIGGRQIKIANGKVVYVSERIRPIIEKYHLQVEEGRAVDESELKKLACYMADILAQSLGLLAKSEDLEFLKNKALIETLQQPDIVTFSGGVAVCMKEAYEVNKFEDIGVLLANAIVENCYFANTVQMPAKETMRATVIGAGNYSMSISGSTIEYNVTDFPIKNIPIVKIKLKSRTDIINMSENIEKSVYYYMEEPREITQIAFAMRGIRNPSYFDIKDIAEEFMRWYEEKMEEKTKIILVIEEDIGKALGQALKRINPGNRDILCIDGVSCNSGDYIDIGRPVANGTVIQVVVKTLVFQD